MVKALKTIAVISACIVLALVFVTGLVAIRSMQEIISISQSVLYDDLTDRIELFGADAASDEEATAGLQAYNDAVVRNMFQTGYTHILLLNMVWVLALISALVIVVLTILIKMKSKTPSNITESIDGGRH